MSEIENYLNDTLKNYEQDYHKEITSEFRKQVLFWNDDDPNYLLDSFDMKFYFELTVQKLSIKSISQIEWEKYDPIEEIRFLVDLRLEKYEKESHKEIIDNFYKEIIECSEIELDYNRKIEAFISAEMNSDCQTISSKTHKVDQRKGRSRESYPSDPEGEWDSMVRNGGDFDNWD